MDLAKFPRRRYIVTRSPIEKLSRLSKRLGGPTLYMKRDDLLGPAGGGNKTRKLEFVVADALEKGADTLITCGAVQSNHCRLTLAATVQEGMKCHLVLEERVKGSYNSRAAGNNLLYHLMGVASITVVAGVLTSSRVEPPTKSVPSGMSPVQKRFSGRLLMRESQSTGLYAPAAAPAPMQGC